MEKNKCKNCVWADKINKKLIYCMFPVCIRKKENKNDKASGNI